VVAVDAELTELAQWIGAQTGGEVTELTRGVVRREAYVATVTLPDGASTRVFVRAGRDDDLANQTGVVVSEARLVELLGARGLDVAPVHGVSEVLGAAIYGWVDGRMQVEETDDDTQQRLLEQYVEFLGRLHTLDPDDLGVDWMARPGSPEECALAHADAIWEQVGGLTVEPLATFGIHWLRNHVPHEVDRVSVLHGDAGVGNFLYEGDTVTGVLDWEWAHLGDPMEDLGSMCMHAGFHPAGRIPGVLAHYEQHSGIPVDVGKVKYYCAHLYVRSVIALAALTAFLDPHNPVALNLSYRIINDRLTCEAIADAMGITLTRPPQLVMPESATTLYDVVAANLRDDVAPALDAEFERNRADMAVLLVESLGRERALGPHVTAAELDELTPLLGARPASVDEGIAALNDAVPALMATREVELLEYLYRRACRTEDVFAPVVSLFPDRVIRPIDERSRSRRAGP
jgi:aminoglycoside phosphotransferase (APT) family kinase protein